MKEHSQLNIPNVVAAARAPAKITKAMIEEAQDRAGKAINLTSGHVHHGGVFRSLLDGGCEWQDILDAIDALTGSMSAKGRQFHSWAIIQDAAVANRDRRARGLPARAPERRAAVGGRANIGSVLDRLQAEGKIP